MFNNPTGRSSIIFNRNQDSCLPSVCKLCSDCTNNDLDVLADSFRMMVPSKNANGGRGSGSSTYSRGGRGGRGGRGRGRSSSNRGNRSNYSGQSNRRPTLFQNCLGNYRAFSIVGGAKPFSQDWRLSNMDQDYGNHDKHTTELKKKLNTVMAHPGRILRAIDNRSIFAHLCKRWWP